MKSPKVVSITVADFNNQPIKGAEVTISAKRENVKLKYDKFLGEYCLEKVVPGRYIISVSAAGFDNQKREVFIGAGGAREVFILGKKGMPYYYRGTVKVPFKYQDENFGIALGSPDQKQIDLLTRVSKKFSLSVIMTHENYRKNGLFLFSYPEKIKDNEKLKLLDNLKKQTKALVVGPVLRQDEKNATILTDEIVVRFKANIEEKQVQAISKRMGLTILRTIPYAGNA
ncbi:MAG: carboxypeptidase regulatory-like domain-containing protein, partial [Flavobacteriales bacterium]|nr:carboxypeptidase regulatory-like domain-containing protein [Flavobacteriales bacterium]